MGTPASPPRDAAAAPLQTAVATVSTAQILRASGYSAAEPSALRALSDIAGRYIASLGRTATALAGARGRTEPNIADLVLALEDHAPGGFPGASDPARPVLRSGALAELAGFVAKVREVPFAKPLPRRDSGGGKGCESFAAVGREPPLRHVPRWLPRFPERWEDRVRGRGELEAKTEEDTGEAVTVMVNGDGNGGVEGRGAVPEKREKVWFRVGKKKRRRVGPDKCGGGFEPFEKN
ncbi:transcription initiation factor TFIID subunit 8-like [Phragmites australis]|uniref:transcription initiation factor TFIID subunit 8-like n=1 Tax=Phragmites australis TaxID=29695 RepID=UPI002D796ADF|nr:transcription initiation factor TFIID subunit 8-like [Phragmites australis]